MRRGFLIPTLPLDCSLHSLRSLVGWERVWGSSRSNVRRSGRRGQQGRRGQKEENIHSRRYWNCFPELYWPDLLKPKLLSGQDLWEFSNRSNRQSSAFFFLLLLPWKNWTQTNNRVINSTDLYFCSFPPHHVLVRPLVRSFPPACMILPTPPSLPKVTFWKLRSEGKKQRQ